MLMTVKLRVGRLLLVMPFAHYGSFFALAGGALSNSIVMTFNFDAFSRRLIRHLNNIFLFGGKNFQDLDALNIYNYPFDLINIDNKEHFRTFFPFFAELFRVEFNAYVSTVNSY